MKKIKILIVDDDQSQRTHLDSFLQKHNKCFSVVFADDGEEAKIILAQEDISLLVTEITIPKVDGFALLSHSSINHPYMPCIVSTSYSIPGLQKRLMLRGFSFLEKPVVPEVLGRLIMQGLQQAYRDDVFKGISLPRAMQMIEAEKKTCLLSIHADGKKQGNIYFNQGVLYGATCGKLRKEDAALQLMAIDDVRIQYQKLDGKKITRQIYIGTQGLTLEAKMKQGELTTRNTDQEHIRSTLQSELLEEGIRLCEGLYFQKAEKLLLELLQKDTGNVLGWLWLSRTFNNMKSIKLALAKAHKLEPQNPALKKEILKINSTAKVSQEQVHRCPFCYTPFYSTRIQCHFCKANLMIDTTVLSKIGKEADHEALHQALERFNRVLASEVNVQVLFYAGLACLNLNDFDGTLRYHEQLEQCFGAEKYRTEVERIAKLIASRPVEKGTVLVVEDSPTIRKVIRKTIEDQGFKVVEASDGLEALRKLNDEPPILILLDVMMPKIDGYGVLLVVKQNKDLRDIPVIMLTSKDSLKDRLKGRFSTASAYLTKPFNPDKLISVVNKLILDD